MKLLSKSWRTCALSLMACSILVACGDDKKEQPTADAGVSTDTSVHHDAEMGMDAETVDMGPDLPPAEFFADAELVFLSLDDELPGLWFVDYELINNGPDMLVIETCSWEAVEATTMEPVAEGSILFCRDCNPIESGDRVIDSRELEGIGESPGDGTVLVNVSLTCLPEPTYEDKDPSNNTVEFMIDW